MFFEKLFYNTYLYWISKIIDKIFLDLNRRKCYEIYNYFEYLLANITMNSLKEYYLEVLLHLNKEHWNEIYNYMCRTVDLLSDGVHENSDCE